MPILTRTRKIIIAALAAMLALVFTACGTPAGNEAAETTAGSSTVSITHAQGTAEVPVNPEKVVVYDVGILNTLDSLGVDVLGVPQGSSKSFPENLEKYLGEDYVNAGALKEPDFEAVNAAEPDLIIITGRTSDSYAELNKIATTIDLSGEKGQNPYETFKAQSTTLGQIFDKSTEVEDKLAEIQKKVDEVSAKAESAPSALVAMSSGGKVTAYGAGSRFGLIFDALGVKPAAEVAKDNSHGEAVSYEFIAEANPGILYVVDRDAALGKGGEGAKAAMDNELITNTDAASNNKLVYLDAKNWYIVGLSLPTAVPMIEEVAGAFAN